MSLASSSKLYQYLQRNPNEQSYRQVIQLPEDTRLEDWLAVVIIEIFDNLSTVYASLAHCCNDMSCPIMSIGVSHEYLWHEFQDTNSSIKHNKIHCSAPKYIRSFIDFVQETISNASIFPNESNHEYPPHFLALIQYICKQIYRVFGHLYLHHLPSVTSLGLHITMNTCFKHYLYFVEEFELIKSSELKPLHKFIQISLCRPFGKRYRDHSSTADLSAPSHDPNLTAFSSIQHSSPNISSLSLPKSPKFNLTDSDPIIPHDADSRPRITARKSEIFRVNTNKKRSLDLTTEYKYNDQSSSVSILSSMNSITPYPTYAHNDHKDGEHTLQSQSKINETVNNRSVYEYIFNRNDTNDSTSSHVAIPDTAVHSIPAPPPPKGEPTQSRNEEEDEEKASVDYIERDTKYNTPTQNVIRNDIDSSVRKCTIIRSINAKSSPSTEAMQHILSDQPAPSLQRIPLLSNSDLRNSEEEVKLRIYSPSEEIINELEIHDTTRKKDDIAIPSPSFRDVVYYRSKVRTLEKEVDQLRDENRALLINGSKKTKKKKRKKKKRPKTNMAKLVDIMNSMNEQITKLAEAVTEAVTSTDEDEKLDGDHMDAQDNIKSEFVEHAEEDERYRLPLCETPSAQTHVRTDLKEYLFGKVLNEEPIQQKR